MNNEIELKKNPVKILMKKLLFTESTQIMIEGTKAIKSLANTKKVIDSLQEDNDLLKVFKSIFNTADAVSQENLLKTVSATCKFPEYCT